MLVIRAGIHNMVARMANREDPDPTTFLEGLCCLSRPCRQLVFEILEQQP